MGLDRYYGYSFRRVYMAFLGDIIFSTTAKVKVIGTPVFLFSIKNPVLGDNFKIYGITMGPGGRGILKSSCRRAWILGTSGLYLVIIILIFTGIFYGGIK